MKRQVSQYRSIAQQRYITCDNDNDEKAFIISISTHLVSGQVANLLVTETRLGHDLDDGEGGPADVVSDGLQVGQLAHSLGLDEHIGGPELGLDLGKCFGDVATGVSALVVAADALHHILQVFLEESH